MKSVENKMAEQVNFYVTESFLMSDFICPCCDTLKIVPAFYRHAGLLEKVREKLDFGILVTSGYRCPRHNARIGGAPRSMHLLFATDIKPDNDDFLADRLRAMRIVAEEAGFTGIGVYEGHLHIDLRPEPMIWRG